MHFSPLTLLLLAGAAMVAGCIDAIAGGGGLLTMPALLLTGLPAPLVLGTNKGQSVFGSGMALFRFARSPLLDRRRAWVAFGPALAGAVLGAALVSQLPSRVLTPLVMGLLAGVAVFMLFYRPPRRSPASPCRSRWPAVFIALLIAAYDGFFGPGTGTFLILAYVLWFRDSLDAASANAKVVNFASNLAALAFFSLQGQVVWQAALPMAAGQATGAFLGAHLTIRIGRTLVRYVVLVISLALLAQLAWQAYAG